MAREKRISASVLQNVYDEFCAIALLEGKKPASLAGELIVSYVKKRKPEYQEEIAELIRAQKQMEEVRNRIVMK